MEELSCDLWSRVVMVESSCDGRVEASGVVMVELS